jgi:hypothetical protein
VGKSSNSTALSASYEAIVPFIIESISQPDADVRRSAMSCLGLICLISEPLCDKFREIIFQVASGDFEEVVIRCEALQSLVDISLVYSEKYKDNTDLCNVLVRLQQKGDPDLIRLASESAAKLLHSKSMSDSRLFSNLIKFFFLSELLPIDNVFSVDETIEFGSPIRLQQFLSLFLKSFMFSASNCKKVVLDSISQLIADMTNEMRNANLDVSAMQKV